MKRQLNPGKPYVEKDRSVKNRLPPPGARLDPPKKHYEWWDQLVKDALHCPGGGTAFR